MLGWSMGCLRSEGSAVYGGELVDTADRSGGSAGAPFRYVVEAYHADAGGAEGFDVLGQPGEHVVAVICFGEPGDGPNPVAGFLDEPSGDVRGPVGILDIVEKAEQARSVTECGLGVFVVDASGSSAVANDMAAGEQPEP